MAQVQYHYGYRPPLDAQGNELYRTVLIVGQVALRVVSLCVCCVLLMPHVGLGMSISFCFVLYVLIVVLSCWCSFSISVLMWLYCDGAILERRWIRRIGGPRPPCGSVLIVCMLPAMGLSTTSPYRACESFLAAGARHDVLLYVI